MEKEKILMEKILTWKMMMGKMNKKMKKISNLENNNMKMNSVIYIKFNLKKN